MIKENYRPQVVGQPTTSKHFKTGINAIGELIATTLGPTSGHVASQRDTGMKVELLDDAATIVRRILSLGTAQDDIGAMVMRSLIWRVSQRAGDGGAMAAVLAREIFNEGLKLTTAGVNSVLMERGVERAAKVVHDALYAQARKAEDEDILSSVARTITKEDTLSAVIGEMSYLLGPDARIIIEKYVAHCLEREYIAGAHYKAKISSMYFYSDPQRKRAVVTDPAVALINDRVTAAEQVVPILESALQMGKKSVLFIVKDMTESALGLLLANHRAKKEKKKLDILSVKLNVIGDEMRWAWADLETMTGATLIGSDYGILPEHAQLEHIGVAQRAEFSSDGMVVVAEKEARAKIQSEVARLRTYIAETPLDDDDRPKYVARMSALAGGVGRLKIGADSKLHREVLYQQADRSFKVLSAAQRNGVVPGGGAALLHCIAAVRSARNANGASENELMGMQLIERVLSAPLRQIVSNAQMDPPAVIVDRVLTAGPSATYDAVNYQVCDAYESGILDVADVLETSFRAAISGAMQALTTDAIVYHKDPEQSLNP
ncbi:hypothetical protein KFU94_17400 [Chloroflexi bacterium TSY]|nr:hypothetical protein [Chloroflexi bacterium TSY]